MSRYGSVERYQRMMEDLSQRGDQVIDLLQILDFNAPEDALWALRAAYNRECDSASRLIAADCAELVLPIFREVYPDETGPRDAIRVARQYVVEEATEWDLGDARRSAEEAARCALWNNYMAASAAAYAAANAASFAGYDSPLAAVMAAASAENAIVSDSGEAARGAAWEQITEIVRRHLN